MRGPRRLPPLLRTDPAGTGAALAPGDRPPVTADRATRVLDGTFGRALGRIADALDSPSGDLPGVLHSRPGIPADVLDG
ncbi:hypothetical protein, partial [Streptomyces mexicanus]|uniref:hypothetical protein n=1 Tax=Streptomyces mexicanus TaxID=178566 RepID=UPI001358B5D5